MSDPATCASDLSKGPKVEDKFVDTDAPPERGENDQVVLAQTPGCEPGRNKLWLIVSTLDR